VSLALETTLKACRLGRVEEGGILRVAPAERLVEELQLERRLEQEREQSKPRRLTLVPLSYARAEEMAPLLQRMLGGRAEVTFDRRTNTLLIKN
jgi:type II secretory pathway component HofQ